MIPALEPVEVRANGIRLHTMQGGSGPLMLFLHGFPQFWYCWRHQLAAFAGTHRVVAPDQRGYNLSDKPGGVDAYKINHLVADVRALAAQLTDRPYTLVAHDWGGAVAWNLAIAHPQELERLVIINSPHPYAFWRELKHSPAQQKASEYMLMLRSQQAEATLSANGYDALWTLAYGWGATAGAADARIAEERAAYLGAWSQPGALTGALNWYRAAPLYPPTPGDPGAARLRLEAKDFRVEVPTLVVHGDADRALLPGLLDGLDALVPRLRIERLAGVSHWVMEEAPERLNAVIRATLEERA